MKKYKRFKKIALVTHPLRIHGGQEVHLKAIAELFPSVEIVTAWHNPEFTAAMFPKTVIRTSFLQKFPFKMKFWQELTPLLPMAYRSINLERYDLVIALTDGFEKLVKVGKDTKYVQYILTPPRFLWMDTNSSKDSKKLTYKIYDLLFRKVLTSNWRKMDKEAVDRADLILANSEEVQKRIAKFYNKESEVLYPPVDQSQIDYNPEIESRKDWYLYFGRVENYKGVNLAIRACAKAGVRLKIAGKGGALEKAKELVRELKAFELIDFLGFVDEEEKSFLMQNCRALIYPVIDEDFGIVPVEANAYGAPVIAYAGGGALETIIEGKTGTFFHEYTSDSLVEAIEKLTATPINPLDCKVQATNFSKELFKNKLVTLINGLG